MSHIATDEEDKMKLTKWISVFCLVGLALFGQRPVLAAEHAGMKYEALLDRILALGLQWNPERVA